MYISRMCVGVCVCVCVCVRVCAACVRESVSDQHVHLPGNHHKQQPQDPTHHASINILPPLHHHTHQEHISKNKQIRSSDGYITTREYL